MSDRIRWHADRTGIRTAEKGALSAPFSAVRMFLQGIL